MIFKIAIEPIHSFISSQILNVPYALTLTHMQASRLDCQAEFAWRLTIN